MKQSTIDEWAAKLEHKRRPVHRKTSLNREQQEDLEKLVKACRADGGQGVLSSREIAGLATEMLGTFVGRSYVNEMVKEQKID